MIKATAVVTDTITGFDERYDANEAEDIKLFPPDRINDLVRTPGVVDDFTSI